jgi:hypothetical protein
MYASGKMIPVEAILWMAEWGINDNDGRGEFNYNVL